MNNFYLTLKVGEVRFGVDARLVQEIVRLPAVAPLEGSPIYIPGVVNLRGKTIPVMDLNMRLGHRSQIYSLSDVLVVLRQESKGLGIIVNAALDVIELPAETIEPASHFNEESNTRHLLVNAVARTDDGLILLLDSAQLFRFSSAESLDPTDLPVSHTDSSTETNTDDLLRLVRRRSFFRGVSAEDQQEFKARAQQFQKHLVSEDADHSMPLAIIKLAGEFLAVELNSTDGFAVLARLTPIPCCPSHIMGVMNLRGDNLTVVDIRGLLNIPHAKEQTPANIMLVKCGNFSLGVPIDEIVDVVHLRAEAINKMPATIDTVDRKYLKGMTTYDKQMLAVVDVSKLLSRPELAVNEEV